MSLDDMNLYDSPLQLARLRQQELQAIAQRQPLLQLADMRVRLGAAIVRFGHRVAQTCDEIVPEPTAALRPSRR